MILHQCLESFHYSRGLNNRLSFTATSHQDHESEQILILNGDYEVSKQIQLHGRFSNRLQHLKTNMHKTVQG